MIAQRLHKDNLGIFGYEAVMFFDKKTAPAGTGRMEFDYIYIIISNKISFFNS
jgi:hypothetical protein